MSSEAIGWAFRHSPYTGATFAVHLAIADSVNDQNDNELWMRQGQLARKARTTRQTVNVALSKLVDDALLVLIEEGDGGANRYRLLMPSIPDVFGPMQRRVSRETTRPSSPPTAGVVSDDTEPVASHDTEPKVSTQAEPKGNTSTVVDAASPEIEALCTHLADRIEQHREGDRPIISARWRRDMRLLVERGPLHVDGAVAQSPEKVRASIDAVFDELAVPDGRSGFCWADQIRSASALRDHWTQLREAYKRTTGGRVGRGAQAVDRVAGRLARDGAESKRQPLGLIVEHEPKEITA